MALEGLGRQLLRSEALASSQIEGLEHLASQTRRGRVRRPRQLQGARDRRDDAGDGARAGDRGGAGAADRRLDPGDPPGDRGGPAARPDRRADPRGAELDRRRRPERRRIRRARRRRRCAGLLDDLCRVHGPRRHLARRAGGDRPRAVRDHPPLRRRQRPRRPLPDPGAASGDAASRRAYVPPISIVLGSRQGRLHQRASKPSATGAVDDWVALLRPARPSSAALGSREFSEEVEALQADWRALLRPVRSRLGRPGADRPAASLSRSSPRPPPRARSTAPGGPPSPGSNDSPTPGSSPATATRKRATAGRRRSSSPCWTSSSAGSVARPDDRRRLGTSVIAG